MIVPVYNGAAYIEKTAHSILSQSFSDLELVLVNDGSTDESQEVLEALRRHDSRVKVFRQENGGIGSARNHGIENSCAPLVAFCDQDDLWEPRKLEKQVPTFDDPEIGLCYARVNLVDASGVRPPKDVEMPVGSVFDALLTWNFVPSCSVVVRRSVLSEFENFEEDRRMMGVDDWHCWLEVALRKKFAKVDEPLCTHLLHADNYSNNYLKMTEAEIMCMDKIAVSARALGMDRDFDGLKHAILEGRARLHITKGDFKGGAKLLWAAHRAKASLSLWFLAAVLWIAPDGLLHRAQRFSRHLKRSGA